MLATQAMFILVEIETETGKSPIVSTGVPIMVSFVGSLGEIERREAVLEAGLHATIICCLIREIMGIGEGNLRCLRRGG